MQVWILRSLSHLWKMCSLKQRGIRRGLVLQARRGEGCFCRQSETPSPLSTFPLAEVQGLEVDCLGEVGLHCLVRFVEHGEEALDVHLVQVLLVDAWPPRRRGATGVASAADAAVAGEGGKMALIVVDHAVVLSLVEGAGAGLALQVLAV